jgi:1-acyl-sn-glycerol-3-phosphate acyltransferase
MNDRPAKPPPSEFSVDRSTLRALMRLAGYFLMTIVILPSQWLVLRLRLPGWHRIPLIYHRACARLMGFDITVKGDITAARPALFVANHVSYIDITVLGTLLRGSFIAKAEIDTWPFFGFLARLQRSVFVDRRPSKAGRQRDELTARLDAGDSLILFPEGTSDDGNFVLPFKSALFAVASRPEGSPPLTVQPVSIAYTGLQGVPLGRLMRPYVAWYGDMELLPHLRRMLGLGRIAITVEFHEPVLGDAFESRKALSDYCYGVVDAGVQAALSGRALLLAPPELPADTAAARS